MNRRVFLKTSALSLAASACKAPLRGATPEPAPPNFVVIIVDDLRWDSLGCMGHPWMKSPAIDRLAREGGLFRNAFCAHPLCSPSRACALTGLHTHAHGVLGNEKPNPVRDDTLITFPRLLHAEGYATAMVGKWHMDNHARPRPGFDHWVAFAGQGVYENPVINIDGDERERRGYVTDLLNAAALDWLAQRDAAQPFCLWLAHKAPHEPPLPAEKYRRLYEHERLPAYPGQKDDLAGKPMLHERDARMGRFEKGYKGDDFTRNQLRTIASVDDGVGAIRDLLEKKGLLENTVLVFTSDHGTFWGEHGLKDKRAAYEEAMRIPLVIRAPRWIKAGTEYREMVSNLDFAPTFLELARARSRASFHGQSFRRVLTGDRTAAREEIGAEYFDEERYPRIPAWRALRTNHWKLIAYPQYPKDAELYDLEADPHELANVIGRPEVATVQREMEARMARWLERTEPVRFTPLGG